MTDNMAHDSILLAFSDNGMRQLDNLTLLTGKTRYQTIVDAIAFYRQVHEDVQKGSKICHMRPDGRVFQYVMKE
jgi:hypothetical protein